MTSSDPAEYQSASETPDMAAEIDSFEDVIREVATENLRKHKKLSRDAEVMILPLITDVVRDSITEGMARGLLHNENSATFTPKFKEILVRILTEIQASTNPRMFIDCLGFAFGLCMRHGMSQTSIAKDYNVTRANVSKVTVQICERYGIPPSRGMKTESARETFSERQMGKVAKPKAEVWTRGEKLKAAFQAARS